MNNNTAFKAGHIWFWILESATVKFFMTSLLLSFPIYNMVTIVTSFVTLMGQLHMTSSVLVSEHSTICFSIWIDLFDTLISLTVFWWIAWQHLVLQAWVETGSWETNNVTKKKGDAELTPRWGLGVPESSALFSNKARILYIWLWCKCHKIQSQGTDSILHLCHSLIVP